ncbi:MAG: alanine racemase, partial [Eubacteriales bacterium]|nr:alanine racemase [Eubacteriales bacterium]
MKTCNPRLQINLNKLRENAQTMVTLCGAKGISVMGVTKSFSADPHITKAFCEGGIAEFADSRIENIIKLKRNGIHAPFMLLRIPMPSQAYRIAAHADMSVNSEINTIRLLDRAASKLDKKHGVMLMVDVGDLREGIWPDKMEEIVPEILKCQQIDFFGLGTNLGCYGGVVPTCKNLSVLVDMANRIDMKYHHAIQIISAGGTSVTKLIEENDIPPGVNQVRLGEALMSGVDSVNLGRHIQGLWRDAFTLIAEIVEIKWKPPL